MRINREEVFGPVASVIKVSDYVEALTIANATPFGLSAGICTTSLRYASHFEKHAQAGMTMVNLPTAGVDYHVPFGGQSLKLRSSRTDSNCGVLYPTEQTTLPHDTFVLRLRRAEDQLTVARRTGAQDDKSTYTANNHCQ